MLSHASIQAMRDPFTEQALWWESYVSCLYSEKFQAQNLLFGFQQTRRCFYTRVFWLCAVHTLKKRFRGKAMFPLVNLRTAKSPKHRDYFLAFSQHVGAFTQWHSGCALSIHWKSVFFWKVMFLDEWSTQSSKHRIYSLAFSQHVGAFTREHPGCALPIRWTSALVGN